jgi:transcriptional regulator with XRE-family HTH domain
MCNIAHYTQEVTMISNEQCRAGRAVLGWTQTDLSGESGVSLRAIQEFEAGARKPNRTTLQGLLAALERHGIEFKEDGAGLSWGTLRGINIDPREIGKGQYLE